MGRQHTSLLIVCVCRSINVKGDYLMKYLSLLCVQFFQIVGQMFLKLSDLRSWHSRCFIQILLKGGLSVWDFPGNAWIRWLQGTLRRSIPLRLFDYSQHFMQLLVVDGLRLELKTPDEVNERVIEGGERQSPRKMLPCSIPLSEIIHLETNLLVQQSNIWGSDYVIHIFECQTLNVPWSSYRRGSMKEITTLHEVVHGSQWGRRAEMVTSKIAPPRSRSGRPRRSPRDPRGGHSYSCLCPPILRSHLPLWRNTGSSISKTRSARSSLLPHSKTISILLAYATRRTSPTAESHQKFSLCLPTNSTTFRFKVRVKLCMKCQRSECQTNRPS